MNPPVTTYYVDGLCCADEERIVRGCLQRLEGVEVIGTNVVHHTITLRHSCPDRIIFESLQKIGFRARSVSAREAEYFSTERFLVPTVIASCLLAGVGLFLANSGHNGIEAILLLSGSILLGGWQIARKALISLRRFALDMNVLMVIATAGAMVIGRWEEAATVIALFSIAHLLEKYSVERARKEIRSLLRLTPETAMVRAGGKLEEKPISTIMPGECVVVRAGERIPLDGHILHGSSFVNQAAVTGESSPVPRYAGDKVYGGTLTTDGLLEIEVERQYGDGVIARIIRLVEEAQGQRAPIQEFIERFARYYTPIVFALAAGVALIPPFLLGAPFGIWGYRALVLLVIACPCALVISTPVAMVSALARAARAGILVKGGRFLEHLSNIQAVAFDKTGTLTEGLPRVTDVIAVNSMAPRDIVRLASAIEVHAKHHLAGAVLQYAAEHGIEYSQSRLDDVEVLSGYGVKVTMDGHAYLIGNHALVEKVGICSPQVEQMLLQLEGEGKTTMIVGSATEVFGVLGLVDEIRPDATAVIQDLDRLGIHHVVMLTGDNQRTAESIARKAGISAFYAESSPEDKLSRIRQLRAEYGTVAMVGDGVNDAPALAAATIGIAMGRSGTEIALESADVVLTSDNLRRIPFLIDLSRRTVSIVRQNIALALVTKALFLVLALSGVATLWMAVLADDGATLLVIANGFRLLRSAGRQLDHQPEANQAE